MSIRVESNAPADLDLENIHALDQLSQRLNASYIALEDQVSDLTQELERVRAARSKELIERERLALRLSALIDSLPGGVLVLDPDHTVILANPQAVELLEAPLLNQNFLRVIEQKAKDISADGKQLNLTSGRLIALSNEVSDH